MAGKSVLIVGGGVIGLCTAYYAARDGLHVTVVERGAPDHDGCSLGNAGLIVPSHVVPLAAPGMVATGLRMLMNPESPFSIRLRPDPELLRWGWLFARAATETHVNRAAPLLRDLHLASRALYEELAAIIGDFGLAQRGSIALCRTEQALDEELKVGDLARQLGMPAETLSREDAALLGDIDIACAGGVYFPLDCHLDPRRLVNALTQSLMNSGVCFQWSTEAIGWKASGGRIDGLETSRGTMQADEYVIAAGSWSREHARSLGLRLPLQAGKGYSMTLPAPKQRPAIPVMLTEARVAVTPMGGGLRFAGTMEIGGLDLTVSRRRVQGIVRSIPAYYPAFAAEDFRDTPVWAGLRPCSPDGLPYVGRFRRYSNLSVATGHAMMGVSLGPITGRIMADLLSDRKPSTDLSLLAPDRFA